MIKVNRQNILLLSDTHGMHRLINIPQNIQIVIHCGDVCTNGELSEIIDFFDWFEQLKIEQKLFIYGNHDLPFELNPVESKILIPDSVFWLNDESISVNGIEILGISSFPANNRTQLNCQVDIVVSHYPPFGILDSGFGSQEIFDFVNKIKPKFHVFGHDHLSFGNLKINETRFINASNYNYLFRLKD